MADLATEPIEAPSIKTPTPRPLSSGAMRGLGIGGMPELMTQFGEATKGRDKAFAERESATSNLAGTRKAGSERLGAVQAQAPADPKLEAIPDKMEHRGLDQKGMNDAMQTMFAFAAIGGAMTRAPMTAAMNSFAKGLHGLAQGDEMLFRRESQEFDRNLKVAIAKNGEAVQKYQLAMDKHKGNLQATMQQIQLDAAAANDSVMLAIAKEGHYDKAVQHIQGLIKSEQQAQRLQQQHEDTMRRMDVQAGNAARTDATNNRRLDIMERQGDRRNDINAERNAIRDKAAAQGGKPTQTERQHYMDSNALLKSVDRITEMLNDPAIRQKIDESRVGNYLSDAVENKAIQTFLVRPNLDPAVKNYLTEVANLRNQYYLDMSGKAVTGGEALRNFGAVVQPMDSAADVLNKMGIAGTRSREKMKDLETYFPSLGAIRGGGGGGRAADQPGAFEDRDKERRYQEWKARQGGGG